MQDRVLDRMKQMRKNLEEINQESRVCSDEFEKINIKDQQRKILVIAKLCDLVEDHATTYDSLRQQPSPPVKEVAPFTGVQSETLTLHLDKQSEHIVNHDPSLQDDALTLHQKSEILSIRLAENCQEAIAKLESMAKDGKKI